MRSRIVVTGMGALSPVGNSVSAMWDALITGRSGAGPITHFDARNLDTHFAAEVKDFDPLNVMDKKEARRSSRYVQFAMAALREALEQSRLTVNEFNRERVGVIIGTALGAVDLIQSNLLLLLDKGPRRISPFFGPSTLPDTGAGQIAIEIGARGPNMSVATACATGIDAIGIATDQIRAGRADVMIAGSADALITELVMAAFNSMRVLSVRNDAPSEASRPFDADRDGFMLGEGAGLVVLESLEHAMRRDAPILGEVVGYGNANDGYHLAIPSEDGDGIYRAMRLALCDGSVAPDEVGYINPHGTGTVLNDRIETQAVKRVFGDHAPRLAISSTKSMTGHLMGAAGSIEAIIALKALQEGVVPPTINYCTPDPACDLDYVPNTSRHVDIDVAMSNSIGLGGHNATLVVRRV